MHRKIIAIHGIGDNQPGWSDSIRQALDIPKEAWIEFNYEDLMAQSFFNKVVVSATRIYLSHTYGPEAAALGTEAEDSLNDIITYFMMNGTRLEIQLRLKELLQEHPDAIILSHSLGSVVAYETLKNFRCPVYALFTLGSPLSKKMVQGFLKVPDKQRPAVNFWFNVWSFFDPVSGKINNLGCAPTDQIHIKNTHILLNYINSQKERILRLFNTL